MQLDRIGETGEEERYCKFCKNWKPKKEQYWQVWHGRWWTKCKECQNEYSRNWRKRDREEDIAQPEDTEGNRRCSRCRKWYPPTTDYFYLKYGKLRRNCITCHNTPRKKTSQDECSSCGATKVNLRGDVDLATNTHYGYLCTKCAKVIEASGGYCKRVESVMKYLRRKQKKKDMINQKREDNTVQSMEGATV